MLILDTLMPVEVLAPLRLCQMQELLISIGRSDALAPLSEFANRSEAEIAQRV